MKEEMKLSKRFKSKLLYFLCLSILSGTLVWMSQVFVIPFSQPCIFLSENYKVGNFLHGKGKEDAEISTKHTIYPISNGTGQQDDEMDTMPSISSLTSNGPNYCDKSHFKTGICFMKGDLRVNSSILHGKRTQDTKMSKKPIISSPISNGKGKQNVEMGAKPPISSPISNDIGKQDAEMGGKSSISSPISNGTKHCNKSHFKTDICFIKGDIRTNSSSSSIFLYTSINSNIEDQEIIRPYPRKMEMGVMHTIDPLHIISKPKPLNSHHKCDVFHNVPAIFFSTGGLTYNFYHAFNDGIIPLYITSRRYNKKVVFVILEYRDWWYSKYHKIISQLSDYPLIDFNSDPTTHCFQEAIVGLRFHDELTIDSSIMQSNESILDFRRLVSQALDPHPHPQNRSIFQGLKKKPKIVILSRNGTRSMTNKNSLIKLAQKIGFSVQVYHPKIETKLGTQYKVISSSNVMIGVHGAGMTNLLFLKPGSTLVQVIPLGIDMAAKECYGEPAKKFGLKYIEYKVDPEESSLYYKYDKTDRVLTDPNSVNKMGWEFTKEIYLDDQYVTLNLRRFSKVLVGIYDDYFNRTNNRVLEF